MKKVIKKFALIFLATVTAACACFGLAGCFGGSGDKGSNWNEYEGVKVAFADEEAYNDGELDESRVLPELNCKLGEKHYMVLDFDIQAPYDNDGRETVTAEVKIQPAEAVKATIQDTNTSTTSNETKDDITTIKATYKIPEKAETVRNIRLVIQLQALKGSEIYFDTSFKSDGEMHAVKTETLSKTAIFGLDQGLEFSSSAIIGYTDSLASEINEIDVPLMIGREYVNLTGIGNRAFYDCRGLTSITIPNSVTSIGGEAFSWCRRLTSITIPDSVTSISYDAFYGCSSLQYKEYDNGLYLGNEANNYLALVKAKDGNITSCEINEKTKIIYSGAFSGCSSLTSITIPNSVTSIGGSAFRGCNSLTSITIPNSVTSIGDYTFRGCSNLTSITIPEGVTSIGDDAFYGCSKLQYNEFDNGLYLGNENNSYLALVKAKDTYITSCEINEGIKIICDRAFDGCYSLTSITIPNGVTSIGNYAFYECSKLTSITIPNSVTSIGNYAFYKCCKLTSITIPESVKSIGGSAFVCNYTYDGCGGLESITVDRNNANYKSENNCLLSKDGKTLILGCKKSIIPDGVTSIGDSAFSGCSNLTSIIIPNSVTSIGEGAFYDCSGLTSITIPNSVTSIGGSVFNRCSRLTSITIPNSVTRIGGGAFGWCGSLTSITFKGTKKQWKAIEKGNNWNYNTGNYTVLCKGGDLTKKQAG